MLRRRGFIAKRLPHLVGRVTLAPEVPQRSGLHVERKDYGPLAVVLSEDQCTQMSRVLGILAAAKRPMRVFSDVDKARKWLDSPAIRGNLPPAQVPELTA